MKKSLGEKISKIGILVFVTLVSLSMVLPFVNLIAVSLSEKNAVIRNDVTFWPIGFQLNTYRFVLSSPDIIKAAYNTIYITAIGTCISLLLTVLMSYSLSKKYILARGVITKMVIFTMLFSPGMIPMYIMVKNLGLIDSRWALILPVSIAPFNLLIMKTFFQSLPAEIEESAIIDGANSLMILFRFAVPLSMFGIATITLFYAVGYWNTFFTAILYLTRRSNYPLQVILQELLALNMELNQSQSTHFDLRSMPAANTKAAVVIVATFPILVSYPVLQKYFVKGVMIGAIKG